MLDHPFLNSLREEIRNKNDEVAARRMDWIADNPYYYRRLINSLQYIVPKGKRVLQVKCSVGFVLDALEPSYGVGVHDSARQIDSARQKFPHLRFVDADPESISLDETFDFVLITSLEDIVDLKAVLDAVKPCCNQDTRVILVHYNYLWHPLVRLSEKLKLKTPQQLHNWITNADLYNLLPFSGYELLYSRKCVLMPFGIPLISDFLNRFIARLPGFRQACMLNISVARPLFENKGASSVSVIVPCRNEQGNIDDVARRMPALGSHTEIIFCDDKSTDATASEIIAAIAKYPEKDIRLVDGPGICKADNVWAGFDKASGDILMVLDADLTVIPEELPYFYEAISKGRGEFINGSRLVYPMHDKAMKPFNLIGNKFFSLFFSFILDTRIKDTLCGTKVLWRRDYEKIKVLRGNWGMKDRWGDYELLFGAAKRHLKIVDLPVHYYERVFGVTKMTNVWANGAVMLAMSYRALLRIKFH